VPIGPVDRQHQLPARDLPTRFITNRPKPPGNPHPSRSEPARPAFMTAATPSSLRNSNCLSQPRQAFLPLPRYNLPSKAPPPSQSKPHGQTSPPVQQPSPPHSPSPAALCACAFLSHTCLSHTPPSASRSLIRRPFPEPTLPCPPPTTTPPPLTPPSRRTSCRT
jgi:hypothetical protein